MDNCITCNAEIVQTPGKRKKLYCSALCRQKAWNKKQIIPPPEYKEGGLYRFENGGFVDIGKEIVDDFIAGKYAVLTEETKAWMKKVLDDGSTIPLNINQKEINEAVDLHLEDQLRYCKEQNNGKGFNTLPLNKENEKCLKKADDFKVGFVGVNEDGTNQPPVWAKDFATVITRSLNDIPSDKEDEKAFDAVPLFSDKIMGNKETKGNLTGKGRPEKPEKVMPQGLSKVDQLRWMRENA